MGTSMLRTLLKTTLAVLAVAFTAVSACGQNTTPSPGSGRQLMFQSVRDAPLSSPEYQANYQKYFELYVMNEDGGAVRRITNNSYWENQPDVSPDGRQVVFGLHTYAAGAKPVEGTDAGWDVAVMNMDGSGLHRLTDDNFMEFMPDWSFDGTKIVFMADANKRSAGDIAQGKAPQYHIFTMNSDGSGATQLTSGDVPGVVNGDPSFSLSAPSRIVYINTVNSSGGDLYLMDEDGSNQRLVLRCGTEIAMMNDPTFSPDGSQIIFGGMVRQDQYGNPIYNLFAVDTSGQNLARITEDDGESDILAQYSPDGERICYMTWTWNGKGTGNFGVRVADCDGSGERAISSFAWEQAPAWIP